MFVFSQMKKPYAGAMSGNEGASIALAYLMSEASITTQSHSKKIGDHQRHVRHAISDHQWQSVPIERCEQLVYHSGIIW
jgi:hypothetical protein